MARNDDIDNNDPQQQLVSVVPAEPSAQEKGEVPTPNWRAQANTYYERFGINKDGPKKEKLPRVQRPLRPAKVPIPISREEGSHIPGYHAMSAYHREQAEVARREKQYLAEQEKKEAEEEKKPMTPEGKAFAKVTLAALARVAPRHQAALKETLDDFVDSDDYLAPVQRLCDFNATNITPQKMKTNLDRCRQVLEAVSKDIPDPDLLFKSLSVYITRDLEFLFYVDNDLLGANLRGRMVCDFIDAACSDLKAQGMMDKSWDEKFESLKMGYTYGFEAYEVLRRTMVKLSPIRDNSLVAAGQIRAAKMVPPEGMSHQDRIRAASMSRLLDVYRENYGLDIPDDVPSPLTLLLADQSQSLAELRVRQHAPKVDLFDMKENTEAEFSHEYGEICEPWFSMTGTYPTVMDYVEHIEKLKAQITKEDGLPENFTELVQHSTEKAGQAMKDRIKDYWDEDWNGRCSILPRVFSIMKGMSEAYGTPKHLKIGVNNLALAFDDLKNTACKDRLFTQLEDTIDTMYQQVFCGTAHPATLLAAKDYIREFRRAIGDSLHDAGQVDPLFLGRLDKAEKWVGHAYDSLKVLNSWLMDRTNLGHDTLFSICMLDYGHEMKYLKMADMHALTDNAIEMLKGLNKAHGVPDALCSSVLAPVIWERCREIAEKQTDAEIHDEVQRLERGAAMHRDIHSKALKAMDKKFHEDHPKVTKWRARTGYRPRGPMTQEAETPPPVNVEALDAQFEVQRQGRIELRAIELMEKGVQRILPNFEAGEEGREVSQSLAKQIPPIFTAETTHQLFEWLEALEKAGARGKAGLN